MISRTVFDKHTLVLKQRIAKRYLCTCHFEDIIYIYRHGFNGISHTDVGLDWGNSSK